MSIPSSSAFVAPPRAARRRRAGRSNPAAVLREVAGAVGLHPVAAGRGADLPARELGEQLRRPPRPREPDRLRRRPPRAGPSGRGLGERAPPAPGLLVDDRRVPQREQLVARRGTGVGTASNGTPTEPLRQLGRVADRRAREAPTRARRRSARRAAGAAGGPSRRGSRTRPRHTCASSTTTSESRRKKSAHRA